MKQNLQVPGKGSRVAGDIEDPVGLGGKDGFQYGWVRAFGRGVKDDDIGTFAG